MLDRRSFMKVAIGVGVSAMIPEIAGCPKFTSNQIADALAIADAAFASVIAIVSPLNPGLAAALGVGEGSVKSVYNSYLIYKDAPAADKNTTLGKLRTAISAAQQNLAGIINQVPDEYKRYVVAYIAVANVLITAIVNIMPKPVAAMSAVAGPALPLPPTNVKSKKQLKEWFNGEITAAGHPEAAIR
jgi:hypothetical protein